MKRALPFLPALALLAFFQLFSLQSLQAQQGTQDNGFLFRVIIDGVPSDYPYGDCGWGYSIGWGGTVTEDICSTIQWLRPDSLGCDTVVTSQSLAGKWALVRRGTCDFSLKAYNAQKAGASAVVIVNHYNTAGQTGCTISNMSGLSHAADVTIPAIFIGRAIGEKIDAALAAGKTVQTCFVFPRMYNAVAAYSYATPISQIDTLNHIGVRFVNRSTQTQNNVVIKVDIKAPNGNVTSLTTNLAQVTAGVDTFVYLPAYLPPAMLGRFEVTYSNNIYTESRDSLHRTFYITPYTFASDNLTVRPGGVATTDANFATANFQQQSGSLYLTGPNGGVASYVTFGIANAAAIAGTGADEITAILYDGDPDDDGVIDFVSGFTDLDNLTGGQVGFANYTMTGTEPADSLITVALSDFSTGGPVTLKPRHPYYLSLLYNATNGTLGKDIAFSASSEELYLNFPTTPLFLDQLYSGYAGATIIERLQLEGYPANLVAVKPALPDESKVVLTPNPANDQLRLDIHLSKVNDAVTVSLIDHTGRFVRTRLFRNFQTGQTSFDVGALPSGTYLVQVSANEGTTMRKVTVSH
jgi:hypothetical protein